MSEILKLVGSKIRDIRKQNGLSQEQLGEKAGFHFTYIGGLERGERNINLKNLEKISEALGIQIYELFGYAKDVTHLSDKDGTLQRLFFILMNRDQKEIKMAINVLSEIFDTYNN